MTNTSLARLSADLGDPGFDGLWSAEIVTSDDTKERKPHPAPLLKAAEIGETPPHLFAYVGDYAGDMLAARAAGMLAVAALWGGIFPRETLLAQQPLLCRRRSRAIRSALPWALMLFHLFDRFQANPLPPLFPALPPALLVTSSLPVATLAASPSAYAITGTFDE